MKHKNWDSPCNDSLFSFQRMRLRWERWFCPSLFIYRTSTSSRKTPVTRYYSAIRAHTSLFTSATIYFYSGIRNNSTYIFLAVRTSGSSAVWPSQKVAAAEQLGNVVFSANINPSIFSNNLCAFRNSCMLYIISYSLTSFFSFIISFWILIRPPRKSFVIPDSDSWNNLLQIIRISGKEYCSLNTNLYWTF